MTELYNHDRRNRWGRHVDSRSRRQMTFLALYRTPVGEQVRLLHSIEDSCKPGAGGNCSLSARVYEYGRLTGAKMSVRHGGLASPAYQGFGRPRVARQVVLAIKHTPEVRGCIHRSHRMSVVGG